MNLGMLRGFGRTSGYRRGPVARLLSTFTVASGLSSYATSARATVVLSGATTAGVLKRALRVTGRGCINWAGIYTNDSTNRTLRLVVIADGNRFVNNTSGAISASDNGFVAIGSYTSGAASGSGVAFEPIEFQRELIIMFASSVAAETDKVSIAYNVETWAP